MHLTTHARRNRFAFTLVELLVVTGIIAVLLAILLPVFARARDTATKVKCMSNLRQLGMAMNAYAMENRTYPRAAPLNDTNVDAPEFFIFWHPTATEALDVVINHSAIAKYLGATGRGLQEIFRCPLDTSAADRAPVYPYSYSMNIWLDPSNGMRCSFTAIQHPGEKVLMVEEDEVTINDGYWVPGCCGDSWGQNWDYLSIRHDSKNLEFDVTNTNNQVPYPARRGNALFVDGHVDFVTREYAHSPLHTLPEK